jgi:hypothetical protein
VNKVAPAGAPGAVPVGAPKALETEMASVTICCATARFCKGLSVFVVLAVPGGVTVTKIAFLFLLGQTTPPLLEFLREFNLLFR